MASQFEELLGPTLLNGAGEEVPSSEALQGKKHVMLYFSAHWCPPCRKFTPLLAAAYAAHKEHLASAATLADDGEIEVVFVSSDSVPTEYEQYRGSMPWLAVPFANLSKLGLKDALAGKYGVRGIPMLVVLDGSTGEVVTSNGRGEYASYFKGEYAAAATGGCLVS